MLSPFDVLAPKVIKGELSITNFTSDGFHPTNNTMDAVLTKELSTLLISWFDHVANNPTITQKKKGTLTDSIESCTADRDALLPQKNRCFGTYGATEEVPIVENKGWEFNWGNYGKNAYQSSAIGDELLVKVAAVGNLDVSVFFTFSYESVGTVRVRCRGCQCKETEVNTLWDKTYSGDQDVKLQLTNKGDPENCMLELANVSPLSSPHKLIFKGLTYHTREVSFARSLNDQFKRQCQMPERAFGDLRIDPLRESICSHLMR